MESDMNIIPSLSANVWQVLYAAMIDQHVLFGGAGGTSFVVVMEH